MTEKQKQGYSDYIDDLFRRAKEKKESGGDYGDLLEKAKLKELEELEEKAPLIQRGIDSLTREEDKFLMNLGAVVAETSKNRKEFY